MIEASTTRNTCSVLGFWAGRDGGKEFATRNGSGDSTNHAAWQGLACGSRQDWSKELDLSAMGR
ncbi:hypothetical protein NG726_38465, partial [Pseudomonas sp. MOB-449]|nr:hypothetical protein [Pseudomonas sp. MOB-449]